MNRNTFPCLVVGLTLLIGTASRGEPLAAKTAVDRPDPVKVAGLIRQLGDNDFYEREAASQELEGMGEGVMEVLRGEAEANEDLEIRHRAAVLVDKIEVVLGIAKGPASSEELVEHLRDSKYPSYREWAAEQLGYVRDEAKPVAVEALLVASHSDDNAGVRVACIRGLGKLQLGTPAVVKSLKGLRRDPDPRIRDEAIKTLSSLPRLLPAPAPVPTGNP